MTRTLRLPILVLAVALVLAAVVHQVSSDGTADSSVRLDSFMPTAQTAGAEGSTWYCAAGSATGDPNAIAEQVVHIANASSTEVNGQITAVPDKGDPVTTRVRVPAHGRSVVRVSDMVKADWASAIVELSGGESTVAQALQGSSGRTYSTCASAPGQDWYFPSGSTRNGTRNLVALFNPFPGEATVDLSFDTDDGARTPQQFQGLVLPGRRVVVVDVAAVVTLREHVSTTVHARAGRVVAEQLQTSDGRSGGEQGLTATLGAPAPSDLWFFPVAAPADSTAHEIVSVMNPGDTDSSVQIQVQIDDSAVVGSVEPYVLSVPSHRSATIDLMADARIPKSAGRWLIVRTTDGSEVVVERAIGAVRSAGGGGLTTTMGLPVVATEWLTTFGNPAAVSASILAVANPDPSNTATVTVTVHGAGASKDLPTATDVRIAPGDRAVFDLMQLLSGRNEASITISSDQPVAVGQWMAASGVLDYMTPSDVPVRGAISMLRSVIDPQVGEVQLDPSLTPGEPQGPTTTAAR